MSDHLHGFFRRALASLRLSDYLSRMPRTREHAIVVALVTLAIARQIMQIMTADVSFDRDELSSTGLQATCPLQRFLPVSKSAEGCVAIGCLSRWFGREATEELHVQSTLH